MLYHNALVYLSTFRLYPPAVLLFQSLGPLADYLLPLCCLTSSSFHEICDSLGYIELVSHPRKIALGKQFVTSYLGRALDVASIEVLIFITRASDLWDFCRISWLPPLRNLNCRHSTWDIGRRYFVWDLCRICYVGSWSPPLRGIIVAFVTSVGRLNSRILIVSATYNLFRFSWLPPLWDLDHLCRRSGLSSLWNLDCFRYMRKLSLQLVVFTMRFWLLPLHWTFVASIGRFSYMEP